MSPAPVQESARNLDLSPRCVVSTTVAASPTAAVETIIATIAIPGDLAIAAGVLLTGFAAFTVGTNGVSGRVRIRRTNASGTVVADSGATTQTAANLNTLSASGFDTAPADGQVYVLTLTVGSASAGSAVSGVCLSGLAI